MGSPINITFLTLDLPDATDCTEVDHIIIYSMVREESIDLIYREVRTICGDSIPGSISTFNSDILIRFITKSSNGLHTGFQLKFDSSRETCGDYIEASTGIISSRVTRFCQW